MASPTHNEIVRKGRQGHVAIMQGHVATMLVGLLMTLLASVVFVVLENAPVLKAITPTEPSVEVNSLPAE
jgi:hypothetical protein